MRISSKTKWAFFLFVFLALGACSSEAADPVVVEVHYQNGVKFYQRGFYDRAIQEFEKTLSLEPEHAEAQGYLDRARALAAAQTRVGAQKSRSQELESLYSEGKRLYAQRDYKAAIEVFEKILEEKRVDDFASFYKERCEILISRELAREKKKEAKLKAKEDAQIRKEEMKKDKAIEHAENKAIAEKRRNDRKERLPQSERAALKAEQKAQRKAEIEEKRAAARQAKEEKLDAKRQAKEEKLAKKRQARDEKIAAQTARREEKLAAKEEIRSEKREKQAAVKAEKAVIKGETPQIEMVAPSEEVLTNKELFVRGIEEYGRKDYELSIATFQQLVESEQSGRKLYSNSAKRLMEKAKKKMKAAEAE